ncbi:type I pullulanase [Miniphocaeibacter halophilus]|uniref:Type I pullulanase n=1 Tax=Miniphocaeibacter halophilus TaxID=2931922 RepID=A0AC61MNL4_9FIRM|nr:type I pullulanase [Miniphocaeibacter halophilus]QQK07105.1 type I pullulanase [Miniphocaeibacter halophilus]
MEINKKLGYEYTKEYTIFRIWSSSRRDITLVIYDDYRDIRRTEYKMKRDRFGLFEIKVMGDLHLKFYNYIIEGKYEITDPYSVASSINSTKSCVLDLEKTDPKGFREHKSPDNKIKDAIIYEVHVKDYSIDKSSNTKEEYRGKFLGLADLNSNYNGYSTGLKNLIDLGITHVHLMPIYDYLTVDEDSDSYLKETNYNWGYDPELFNNIEGSYSTDPENPISRIYELKTMIQRLHENGISVIMDVVYNHTYRTNDSNFNILSPGYFYRLNGNGDFSNGSGCGNEFKSESTMGRKFIIDSLVYYATEYKIDGFRFDLMALIDIETINMAIKKLREINPNIIIYGEPWMALDSPLPINERTLAGSQKEKEFAVFNADFRDAIKGDNDGNGKGYIQGDFYLKNRIEKGIAGSIDYDKSRRGFAHNATESINYFNAHDNLIIMDKLLKSVDDKENLNKIYKMVFNILFTSLGIPFFHSGNEFMRDKKMSHNSYNAPLEINGINWQLKEKNIDIYNYIAQLIKFRKTRQEFKIFKNEDIKKSLFFLPLANDGIIIYTIKKHNNRILLIIHNCNRNNFEISLKKIKKHISQSYEIYKVKDIKKVFNDHGIVNEKLEKQGFSIKMAPLETEIYEIEI